MTGHELVAEVWRSGFRESVHHGSVVAVSASGEALLRVGQPDEPMLPRSSNKPMQALAMLRHGLDLDGELLALACASHSGETFHLDGVRRILAGAGLTVDALQCPLDLPIGEAAREAHLAAGLGKAPFYMNCSGKHAAMLATCVVNGWPLTTYRDPAHPLQRAIASVIASLTGSPVAAVGIDGCGAPVFGVPLTGLARAFGTLASATSGPERRIADAMRAYPSWVGGTGPERHDTRLMQSVPGLLAKDGAEAVGAVGLPDGRGVAVKIADGTGNRARTVAMVAALRLLGVDAPDELATVPVLGHGEPVGEVRPAGLLAAVPALR